MLLASSRATFLPIDYGHWAIISTSGSTLALTCYTFCLHTHNF